MHPAEVIFPKHEDLAKSFGGHTVEGPLERFPLAVDDRPAHTAGAAFVSAQAGRLRDVEQDGHGGYLALSADVQQGLARFRAQRRAVSNRKMAVPKPQLDELVKEDECLA